MPRRRSLRRQEPPSPPSPDNSFGQEMERSSDEEEENTHYYEGGGENTYRRNEDDRSGSENEASSGSDDDEDNFVFTTTIEAEFNQLVATLPAKPAKKIGSNSKLLSSDQMLQPSKTLLKKPTASLVKGLTEKGNKRIAKLQELAEAQGRELETNHAATDALKTFAKKAIDAHKASSEKLEKSGEAQNKIKAKLEDITNKHKSLKKELAEVKQERNDLRTKYKKKQKLLDAEQAENIKLQKKLGSSQLDSKRLEIEGKLLINQQNASLRDLSKDKDLERKDQAREQKVRAQTSQRERIGMMFSNNGMSNSLFDGRTGSFSIPGGSNNSHLFGTGAVPPQQQQLYPGLGIHQSAASAPSTTFQQGGAYSNPVIGAGLQAGQVPMQQQQNLVAGFLGAALGHLGQNGASTFGSVNLPATGATPFQTQEATAVPPAAAFPHIQAPPATAFPHIQAPPATAFPHTQAPPATAFPHTTGTQAPPATAYPHTTGTQAPPATTYPHTTGTQAPPATAYPHTTGTQAPPATTFPPVHQALAQTHVPAASTTVAQAQTPAAAIVPPPPATIAVEDEMDAANALRGLGGN